MPTPRAHAVVVLAFFLAIGAAAGLGALILYRIVAAIVPGVPG